MMLEQKGPDDLYGVFTDDEGPGFLCVYQASENKVLAQVQVYPDTKKWALLNEKDVLVMWSTEDKKCGVTICGWMWAIINIQTGEEIPAPITNDSEMPIKDAEWLKGFYAYLDQDRFMKARGRFWREQAKQYKSELPPESEVPPLETNFILYERGRGKQFCVFEDDADTGYLYLYDSESDQILERLHIYDYPKSIGISRHDVDVVWSEDYSKCGVIIWGAMRGIIDLVKHRAGRVKLEHRDSPGIADRGWLRGFEYLRDSTSHH